MSRLDPRLRGFATDLRNQPTPIEAALWKRLRGSQLGGFKLRRQAVIGRYIADFCCPAIGLIVDVDGNTHDMARDARRDNALADMGFKTLRFTNHDIGANLDGVLATIVLAAQSLPPRFLPHPATPSPEGEGEI